MRKNSRKWIFTVFAAVFFFILGAAFHRYKPWPYGLIKRTAQKGLAPRPYDPDGEILRFAFTGKLENRIPQKYPACFTIDEVSRRINAYWTDVRWFWSAFEDLVIDSVKNGPVTEVYYHLHERAYSANALFVPGEGDVSRQTGMASLIIPGSGENQATPIFFQDEDNYQSNIAGVSSKYSDTYILVKPNHDFLAIHNGKNRINLEFINGYLLNRGGSYSALYLIHSLALVKHLKDVYPEVMVLGISQGANAALLNALQSEPAGAVIASKYTVLFDKLLWAQFNQIIIPGADLFDRQQIRRMMAGQGTKYLITYGRRDVAFNRVEAEEGYTAAFFKCLPNVQVRNHEGAHEYPLEMITVFYQSLLPGER